VILTVRVTPAHLSDNDKWFSHYENPISVAMRDLLVTDKIAVAEWWQEGTVLSNHGKPKDSLFVFVNDYDWASALPPNVKSVYDHVTGQYKKTHRWNKVKPFEFELDIPDKFVRSEYK